MKHAFGAAALLGVLSLADVSRATIGFICNVRINQDTGNTIIQFNNERFCGGSTLKTHAYCTSGTSGCSLQSSDWFTAEQLSLFTQLALNAAYEGRVVDFSSTTSCNAPPGNDCGSSVTFYANR